MNKPKTIVDPVKINTPEYETRGREYLMTNFFVIVVFELLAKPLSTFFFGLPIISIIGESFSKNYNFLFSTFPNANSNMSVIIFSLLITGMYCGVIFKISRSLFHIPQIQNYILDDRRKSLYTDGFGATILLSFLITGILVLVAYPILGILIISLSIMENRQRKG